MKIRNGFVSNSSSASFLIPWTLIAGKAVIEIENMSGWSFYRQGEHYCGTTARDEQPMLDLLKQLNIPEDSILWIRN